MGVDHFDFVIVGGGTAGSLLANRLSEGGKYTVALLEAGGIPANPWLYVPSGFFRVMSDLRLGWGFETAPSDGLGGRSIPYPRGRVLGGSGAINGLVHIRGQRQDFDHWRDDGSPGWSYDDLKPCFDAVESEIPRSGRICLSKPRYRNPLFGSFLAATGELGYPGIGRFDPDRISGAAPYDLAIAGRFRSFGYNAFLQPARKRPNLEIRTGVTACGITISEGRATGVRCRRGGQVATVFARREVILCAGAIGSPHLMQVSGIGDGDHLQRIGVKRVAHVPGVGRNLHDHVAGRLAIELAGAPSINTTYHSWPRKMAAALQYVFNGEGPLMLAAAPYGLFANVRKRTDFPDMQFFFVPATADSVGGKPHRAPGATVSFYQCHPKSRGSVLARNASIGDAPDIAPNFFSDPDDCEFLVHGLRFARRLVSTKAFFGSVRREIAPGPEIASDEDAAEYFRSRAGTAYHPVGTCRMGNSPDCVVDEKLLVKNVSGLRVADASIMPRIVSGNTNAATLAISEKASRIILREAL